jgi:hypothetical protein
VYFYGGGGTWNHNGTIVITVTTIDNTTGAGYGAHARPMDTLWVTISSAMPAHTSPLAGPPPSGVYFYGGGGTWNHNGTVTITVINTTTGAGYGMIVQGSFARPLTLS